MQHYIYKDGTCFIPSTTRTDGQIPLCHYLPDKLHKKKAKQFLLQYKDNKNISFIF